MTADPLAKVVHDLRDLLYRLGREWEAAEEQLYDNEQLQNWLHATLAEGYPFGRSLDDLIADMDVWAEHVENTMTALAATKPDLPLDQFGKPTVAITREQLEAWAGRRLTDAEVAALDTAIPTSSIPDAIGEITANL